MQGQNRRVPPPNGGHGAHLPAFATFALVASLMAPAVAQAADGGYYPRYGTQIRVSPYTPRVSTNPDVLRVRDEVYGADNKLFKRPLMISVDVDYYLSDSAGLLGVYGRAGYWQRSVRARLCTDIAGNAVQCTAQTILESTVGNDSTKLTAVPLGLGVVYRFDYLRRRFDFPLLLSAKAGLDYYLWWSTLGDSPSQLGGDGKNAKGGTLGGSVAVQAAFPLDYFGSRRADYGSRATQQLSYLFVELSVNHVAGLFQKQPRLDFSSLTLLSAGLSVDLL